MNPQLMNYLIRVFFKLSFFLPIRHKLYDYLTLSITTVLVVTNFQSIKFSFLIIFPISIYLLQVLAFQTA